MKKVLLIALLGLLWCSKGYTKILNIENSISLDLPNEYYFINVKNISNHENYWGEDFVEFLEDYNLDFYIIGSESVIDFFEKSLSGQNMEKEDWVLEIVEKIEKKAQKTKSRKTLANYAKKKLTKTMIDYNLTSWTLVLVSNKSILNYDTGEIFDISQNDLMEGLKELGISNNLKDLNKTDLKKIQNESNKLIKQNSKFVANEYLTYKFSPLTISKDKSKDVFLSGKTKILASVWDELKFSYNGKYYFTLKDNKFFGVYQECLFRCSKFNEEFKKMIKPITDINSKNKINRKKNLNLNNESLVENLQKLNDLYKSGALTKEEFEKAKKKLLN